MVTHGDQFNVALRHFNFNVPLNAFVCDPLNLQSFGYAQDAQDTWGLCGAYSLELNGTKRLPAASFGNDTVNATTIWGYPLRLCKDVGLPFGVNQEWILKLVCGK
ncbi:hypothetical protein A3860_07125 [Niastella vici]|uniref:Uncharacterized protein n=1 Tax=Niastella vici TaxID=1703345 RepID=A0A1V9FI97_9BACT|nr:hypothetical protein A3860_07125 [Niastella vici]